ncbi:MAG TPA: acyl-CoA dehydrogenase family protein [Hyphomicrobiaceae bacterium]|nr:acyl-CoA dehydrogenase family protein [Hyphomicrobiaceae bacterium]
MQQRHASSPNQSSAIAPDTRGWNFYAADQSLRDLLALYLAPDLLAHLEPHLLKLGEMAANELDIAAHLADRHQPILHHRDRFGENRQWIEYHPAYRQLEEAAYGTFGMHAMSHRGGVMGWPESYPAVAKHAFTYLFNQTEFGLGCPINVTDSGAHVLRLFVSDEVKERFLPRMLTTDTGELWQGAQFMTEKEGGSDVGRSTTIARLEDGQWRIYGDKWFCSNADGKSALLLARPEGAPEGTRGLGLFAMPRILDDGTPNRYRIVRLKDKLGTRSMASGEIVLEGALAYPVGPLENGIKQMLEMVNWSRLSNGVKSSALMRRAVHDARAVFHGRKVFGTLIAEKPLARRQMLKIALPAEQALSLWMFAAEALDRSEGYSGQPASQEAKAILRIATPVLKFRATRDARRVTGDAMDMRGGIGYVEEWINPRLVRDSHLGSIWEGTGNIVALDIIGRAVGKHSCHEPFIAALKARLDDATGLDQGYRRALASYLDRAGELAATVAGDPAREIESRHAGTLLYHAATAALLAWEGHEIHRSRGDARRILWSKLVADHHLAPRDPFAMTGTSAGARLEKLLLSDEPVPLAAANSVVSL